MKLLIELPDNIYSNCCSIPLNAIERAVKAGTPLPEIHNGFISADVIDRFKERITAYGKDYSFSCEEVLNILGRYEGIYKKKSIPATKEGESE